MSLRRLLLALSLLTLSGCFATLPPAPTPIPPPPVALVSRCAAPPDLPDMATARDLAEWAVQWVGTAGCERAKRTALIDAWPR